jgi:hypothetical protein
MIHRPETGAKAEYWIGRTIESDKSGFYSFIILLEGRPDLFIKRKAGLVYQ